MDDDRLTRSQEEYFRTVELLDEDGQLADIIATAKVEVSRDNIVRGFTRIRGFRKED